MTHSPPYAAIDEISIALVGGPPRPQISAESLYNASFVSGGDMHFLLFYDFVPDYLQRRTLYRGEHLRVAWEAQQRGELILGGALADPIDSAVLLFQGPNDAAARAFAQQDPYVKAGLVTGWKVRPWTTVVGDSASTPVREV